MKVNVELFEVLSAFRAHALVVVATDNMDCFVNAFEYFLSRHRHHASSIDAGECLRGVVDELLESTRLGHVGHCREDGGGRHPQLGFRASQSIGITPADPDPAAFAGQAGRDRPADTPGATGHQGRLAAQAQIHDTHPSPGAPRTAPAAGGAGRTRRPRRA